MTIYGQENKRRCQRFCDMIFPPANMPACMHEPVFPCSTQAADRHVQTCVCGSWLRDHCHGCCAANVVEIGIDRTSRHLIWQMETDPVRAWPIETSLCVFPTHERFQEILSLFYSSRKLPCSCPQSTFLLLIVFHSSEMKLQAATHLVRIPCETWVRRAKMEEETWCLRYVKLHALWCRIDRLSSVWIVLSFAPMLSSVWTDREAHFKMFGKNLKTVYHTNTKLMYVVTKFRIEIQTQLTNNDKIDVNVIRGHI